MNKYFNLYQYAVCKIDNKYGDVVPLFYPNGDQRLFYKDDNGKWFIEYDKFVDNKQQLCVGQIDFFMEISIIDEIDEILPSIELIDNFYAYGTLCDIELVIFDYNKKNYALSVYENSDKRRSYRITEIDKTSRDGCIVEDGIDFFTINLRSMLRFIKKMIIERVKK